jgi:hypothetical protein
MAWVIDNAGQVEGSAWLPENWLPANEIYRFYTASVEDQRTSEMSDLNELIS